MNDRVNDILAGVQEDLKPPTQAECDQALARWLFGKRSGKMMRHAPWSFALLKLLWKEGEAPWQS